MLNWPPTVDDVKDDLKIAHDDTRDDARLSAALGAATDLVTRLRGNRYNLTGASLSPLPTPTEDLILGTVRLAVRWYTRGRSPDGLVVAGDFGTSRVPSFDADIDRLLGLGRYRSPVIG